MTSNRRLPLTGELPKGRRVVLLAEDGRESGELYIHSRQPSADERVYSEQMAANRWATYSAAMAWVKDVRELSSLRAADTLLRIAIGDGRIKQRPDARPGNMGGDVYEVVARQPDVAWNDVRAVFPEVIDGEAVDISDRVLIGHQAVPMPPKKPGRPGIKDDVIKALKELRSKNEWVQGESRKSVGDKIRTNLFGSAAPRRGYGDDAIVKHIKEYDKLELGG